MTGSAKFAFDASKIKWEQHCQERKCPLKPTRYCILCRRQMCDRHNAVHACRGRSHMHGKKIRSQRISTATHHWYMRAAHGRVTEE